MQRLATTYPGHPNTSWEGVLGMVSMVFWMSRVIMQTWKTMEPFHSVIYTFNGTCFGKGLHHFCNNNMFIPLMEEIRLTTWDVQNLVKKRDELPTINWWFFRISVPKQRRIISHLVKPKAHYSASINITILHLQSRDLLANSRTVLQQLFEDVPALENNLWISNDVKASHEPEEFQY